MQRHSTGGNIEKRKCEENEFTEAELRYTQVIQSLILLNKSKKLTG